jgi:hypothetical protein
LELSASVGLIYKDSPVTLIFPMRYRDRSAKMETYLLIATDFKKTGALFTWEDQDMWGRELKGCSCADLLLSCPDNNRREQTLCAYPDTNARTKSNKCHQVTLLLLLAFYFTAYENLSVLVVTTY